MKFHLIRHGQTEANVGGKMIYGTEVPLNEKGLGDAEKLAEYIAGLEFDQLWCSPLLRARQTIAPLLKIKDVEVQYKVVLCEGIFNLDPDAPITTPEYSDETGFPAENESVGSFRARVNAFISEIKEVDDSETVVCITHGNYIRETLNMLMHSGNYSRFPVDNCSDTLIELGEDQIVHYVNRCAV
ncbi:MAG: histidine phosphatase family protein [Planctomycetota bacterium]